MWWEGEDMKFNKLQREVFKKLHETKAYSDLTLEASENLIEVTEFDAAALNRMLDFMYLGEYEAEDTAHIDIKTAVEYQNDILSPEYIEHNSDNDDDDNNHNHNHNHNHNNDHHYKSSKAEPDFSEWTVDTEYKADALLAMLEPHIGVNAIADYYDIPPLKDRAQAMIFFILRTSWSARGFLGAVGEVYKTTADKRLHNIMATMAMDHLHELIGIKEFADMDIPSAFAIDVIRRTGKRLRETEDSFHFAKARDLREINESLKSAVLKIDATAKCRHCSAKFSGVVRERHHPGQHSTYLVRCRRCGTKH
ncbi:hypothetical protein UA08_03848 [Talaromyces atroroseus]|uniref:BTB domain-containing protein n=1 Tax=Talaromyces atroroseus TaxID=1441469 RepID=A0A225B3I7_TALAT|nr:hypothetical protein UA08_03848 [Talaromyces atroroseus]OKL61395.1 hypothetical protein UA08_03848 [Talaromyces atroroseus]